VSFTGTDLLLLAYAVAGLLGAFGNVVTSGRTHVLSGQALTTYVVGFLAGLLWTVQGFIEFSDATPFVARLGVVGAVTFFGVDTVRNLMARRFSLTGANADEKKPEEHA
jgi:hypothetical protein